MTLVATLLITLASLAAFALAMSRHHRHLFGRPPGRKTALALRTAGWLLLAVSPLPWMAGHGAWLAFVAWIFCGLPVIGLVVVAILSFAPPARRPDPESSASR